MHDNEGITFTKNNPILAVNVFLRSIRAIRQQRVNIGKYYHRYGCKSKICLKIIECRSC